MQAERWRRIEQVLLSALEVPERERSGFVLRACAAEPELKRQVLALLEADRCPDRRLETRELEAGPAGGEPQVGRRIGPYTLLRKLGEGGMSVVYLAARADEGFQRRVAVKLIRHGLDPRSLERFQAERQILARFHHPNIARLYDGGTTGDGAPFLVMEHVEGVRIDRYCQDRRLGVGDRLELFCQVCDAVQYAHQRLVIHRDLKPANVLVGDDGRAKLLDFGIAKLLDPVPSAGVWETTQGWPRPMTPAYASPEQLSGEVITTASDVYSLGVVLYELLTGRLPFPPPTRDAASPRAGEHGGPVRPSLAVAHSAEPEIESDDPGGARSIRGYARSDRLRRALRGDLDSIVLRALRCEPGERYASALQLAEDVRSHLAGLPVSARKAAWRYRAWKFARRNKLAVGLGSGFVAVVLGFAVAMGSLATEIGRQRDRLRVERDRAEQVATFLQEIFDLAGTGRRVTARQMLEGGADRLGRELSLEPEVKATLLDVFGTAYRSLGLYDRAGPLLEEALALRRRGLGPEHPRVGDSLYQLGVLASATGDFAVAEKLLLQAVGIHEASGGDWELALAGDLAELAWLSRLRGEFATAEARARRALEIRRRRLDERHPEMARALYDLARVLHPQHSKRVETEALLREALALGRRSWGKDSPDTALVLKDLAALLRASGALEEAEQSYREALAIERVAYDEPTPELGLTLNDLAIVLQDKGDFAAAEQHYREALELLRELLGEDHARVAWTLTGLGTLYDQRGEAQRAEPLFQRAVETLRRALPPGSPLTAHPLTYLGRLRLESGDPAGAEPLLREALELREKALDDGNPLLAETRSHLGGCLVALGRYPEAEELLSASRSALLASTAEGQARRLRDTSRYLAALYEAWGKTASKEREASHPEL